METITLPVENPSTDFREARRLAAGKAGEILSKPVIVAWKNDRTRRFGPEIPGATDDRWYDYGESFSGKVELTVGDEFHFIFTEAADFKEPDLNLSSISGKDGTTILCVNNACTEEDLRKMGHFPGGVAGE